MTDSDYHSRQRKSVKLIKNFRPRCAARLEGIDSKLDNVFTLAYLLRLRLTV